MDLTPLIMDMVSILSTASMGIFAVYLMSSMIKDKRKKYEDNPVSYTHLTLPTKRIV